MTYAAPRARTVAPPHLDRRLGVGADAVVHVRERVVDELRRDELADHRLPRLRHGDVIGSPRLGMKPSGETPAATMTA